MYASYKYPLMLTIMVALAYMPVLSGVMSVTNDAQVVTYPVFYFFSTQLSTGHIPWWHYNIHAGFPLHADAGTPFWNPLFWFFAFCGSGYYCFTLYISLHIFIASFAFYRLCRWLGIAAQVAVFLSVVYVCSGYFSAHLQHPNNLTEAAFLPLILLYYAKLLARPQLWNAICLAVSIFFFVNSGYPAFPVSVFYFLFTFTICWFFSKKQNNLSARFFLLLFTSLIFSGLLCLPYLVSVYEIYNNYYQATTIVNKAFVENGGIVPASFLSFLWPVATLVNEKFYGTAIAWNNMFTGTLFFTFFIFALFKLKHLLKFPLLLSGVTLLLLSFQGFFKANLYAHLPGLNSIRSNGELRIYFVTTIILISGLYMHQLFAERHLPKVKGVIKCLLYILLATGLICFILTFKNKTDFTGKNFYTFLKNISIAKAIFIESLIALLFVTAALCNTKRPHFFLCIMAVEVIAGFWLCLPYTSLGLDSVKTVNDCIKMDIGAINKITPNSPVGTYNHSFYSGRFVYSPALYATRLAVANQDAYPSLFKSYADYRSSTDSVKFVNKQGIYLKQMHNTESIKKVAVYADFIGFTVNVLERDTVVVLQNYSSNWHLYIDNCETPFTKADNTFISFPVAQGLHTVRLQYHPVNVLTAFFISLAAWIFLLLLVIGLKILRKPYPIN